MTTQTKAPDGGEPARDEQIKQLRRELDRLRRENLKLSRLAGLREKEPPANRAEEALEYQAATRRLLSSRSYASYLGSFIRSSSPFKVWNNIVSYTRRLRLLSAAIRILARMVAIIEASAVLLILASAALILVPLLLVIFVIAFLAASLERKRLLRKLTGAVQGRDVYVFFAAEKEQLVPGSFYFRTLEELACAPENPNLVIVVSPALHSDGSLFLNAKRFGKAQNIYIVRRHFYFRLRKVLVSRPASLTHIY